MAAETLGQESDFVCSFAPLTLGGAHKSFDESPLRRNVAEHYATIGTRNYIQLSIYERIFSI